MKVYYAQAGSQPYSQTELRQIVAELAKVRSLARDLGTSWGYNPYCSFLGFDTEETADNGCT